MGKEGRTIYQKTDMRGKERFIGIPSITKTAGHHRTTFSLLGLKTNYTNALMKPFFFIVYFKVFSGMGMNPNSVGWELIQNIKPAIFCCLSFLKPDYQNNCFSSLPQVNIIDFLRSCREPGIM